MANTLLREMSSLARKPLFSVGDWVSFSDEDMDDVEGTRFGVKLYCSDCASENSFVGRAISYDEYRYLLHLEAYKTRVNELGYMSGVKAFDERADELVGDSMLQVDNVYVVRLSCPHCGYNAYICFVVEFQDAEGVAVRDISDAYKLRVCKIGEYPNQDYARVRFLEKYRQSFGGLVEFLSQAERAYYFGLGTASVAYLRKAYESLVLSLCREYEVDAPQGNFKQSLNKLDEFHDVVPNVLKGKAYGLFGEMCGVVHGSVDGLGAIIDVEDTKGIEKYELIRDVLCSILDNILEKRRNTELVNRIQSDEDASQRNRRR